MISSLKRMFMTLMVLLCMNFVRAAEVTLEVSGLEHVQGPQGKPLPTVFVGDVFTVKIIVHGDRDTGKIEIQGLDQFKVLGQSHSTNITIINGQSSSEIAYVLDVQADQEGVFAIGPAFVAQRGKPAESNVVTMQVLDDGKRGKVATAQPPIQSGQPTKKQVQEGVRPELLCEFVAKKNHVFVGEPIEVCVKICTRGQILQYERSMPTFKGFLSKEIKQIRSGCEVINGKEYFVEEKKYVLWPVQQGDKELEPIRAVYAYQERPKQQRGGFFDDTMFAGFFGAAHVRQDQTMSKPLQISVDPLPPYKGRVDGVGVFTRYKAVLDKDTTGVNEPIVMRLEIEGKGNLEQIAEPRLNLPEWVKSYKSKATVHEDLSQAYTGGKKIFEFVLQATKAGTLQIPAQTFTYFDPDQQTYQTLQTSPLLVSITSSGAGASIQHDVLLPPEESAADKNGELSTGKKDIHFIHEDTHASQDEDREFSWWFFFVLLFVPCLLFTQRLWTFGEKLIPQKWYGNHKLVKLLLHAESELNKVIDQEKTAQLYHFFLKYLAVKFGGSLHEVTEKWIVENLRERDWSPEKITEFVEFLNECASLHFVAQQRVGTDGDRKLLKKAKYWVLVLST